MLSIIVAMNHQRIIGFHGRIPWALPEDQQLFRRITMGHTLIMGRKTFESIGRPLDGRRTIVITSEPDWSFTGVDVAGSLAAAISIGGTDDLFICGGARLYQEALLLADRIYLTVVDFPANGDTFFPEMAEGAFRELSREVISAKPYAESITMVRQ